MIDRVLPAVLFRSSFRALGRAPGTTAIKIAGLMLGLAACLMILEYVRFESSYDRYHEKADRIVRITDDDTALTPAPAGPALLSGLAGVEQYVRILPTLGDVLVRRTEDTDIRAYENRFYFADPSVFDVFTFPITRGTVRDPLRRVDTVVISEAAARRYFGETDPVGRQLTLDVGFTIDFTITAVMSDVPRTSHFRPDILANLSSFENLGFVDFDGWDAGYFHTYVLLERGRTKDDIRHVAGSALSLASGGAVDTSILVQKLTDIYLTSDLEAEHEPPGDPVMLAVFTVVAILILLTAVANFVTLSTSRFTEFAREVGVRKTLGASRSSLAGLFMFESLVMAGLAGLLAVILVTLSAPALESLTGHDPGYSFDRIISLSVVGSLVTFCAGILAGLYPAIAFPAVSPAEALRGRLSHGAAGVRIRHVLVVGQFVSGIILISSSLVVWQQLTFLRSTDPGFDAQQTISVAARMYGHATSPIPFDALIDGFSSHSAVLSVAATDDVPGERPRRSAFFPQGMRDENDLEKTYWSVYSVDYDAVETLGIDVVDGRSFSRDVDSDQREAFLINRAALAELRQLYPDIWQQPIGRRLDRYLRADGMWIPARFGQVIGVVDDFHFRSLHTRIEPLVIQINRPLRDHLLVRTRARDTSDVLSHLSSVWSSHMPDRPFEYTFLDDAFADAYAADRRMAGIVGVFSVLAIVIAVLGLVGLAYHRAAVRRREMAIRKSLGAGTTQLALAFTKEFAVLVLAATVLAVPIAALLLEKWLSTFAYRIELPWIVFAGSALLMMATALITVAYQAVSTARLNPASVLSEE